MLGDHRTPAVRVCAEENCSRSYTETCKWDAIKAFNEGWFFSRKTGLKYCPDHTPEWVAEWRERKETENEAGR